jgi:Condensation domain
MSGAAISQGLISRQRDLYQIALEKVGSIKQVIWRGIARMAPSNFLDVSNTRSEEVLTRELITAYEAFAAGAEPRLPELPIQYADFAQWERENLRGEALDKHLAYWRRNLADLPALDLPTDRPRPVWETFLGESESFELPPQPLACIDQRSLVRRPLNISNKKLLGQSVGTIIELAPGSPGYNAGCSTPWMTVTGRCSLVGLWFWNMADGGEVSRFSTTTDSAFIDCQWIAKSTNNEQSVIDVTSGGGFFENA